MGAGGPQAVGAQVFLATSAGPGAARRPRRRAGEQAALASFAGGLGGWRTTTEGISLSLCRIESIRIQFMV